uniref:C2H2-type domain-containing protein n=1 Tax=Glossina brevipalpis TaxID=37001 RepID=A0A1A9W913_9MUSC
MSRFGLRSNADGFKISEEKFSRRKLCKSTSAATASIKRALQQKDNEDNVGDEKNLELKDIEGTFDPITSNDDDGNEGLPLASAIVKGGALVCRLPLERITDIIQKLNLNKTETDVVDLKETNDQGNDEVEEVEDEEDDEDKIQDVNLSKPTTAMIKILCLYCDKKFSSHKMQLKHVDKFHCQQPDRRCSVRNALVQQTSGSRKRKPNIGQQSFPGCTYCQKAKGQQIQLPAANGSDLNALFVHLTDCHADRYFGCKTCVLRFQNIGKLSKHMQVVHKSLSFAFDENSKSKDNDPDLIASDKQTISERSRLSVKRQQRSQTRSTSSSSFVVPTMNVGPQCSTAISTDITVIGAEEPILSRLGLTQNRLPNNRKGVRLRRENLLPEALLKSEQNPTTNFTSPPTPVSATCSPKLRGKAVKHQTNNFVGDATTDVIFRVPTRNDILSCVFDDNFYKEVVSNVRNNLLFHLDGKIMGSTLPNMDAVLIRHTPQPQIRSTLVKSPIVVTTMDSEIHAATSLAAVTAFPTLLTAKQYGGDATSAKIRRPHTKNSWKWKWDSVKKFKLVNEGGKIVKKMKHPMFGLRDLSKLDMWTQLTMRQKHEHQHHQQQQLHHQQLENSHPDKGEFNQLSEVFNDPCREEKQRLNDQLNLILDMRLLPHIILEQSEQAIIKVENDEFGIGPTRSSIDEEDCTENIMNQTFADESFLSMLNLIPKHNSDIKRQKLVLSGEWARPRCYLCMCCGAKFEKIKSLEEHKMFRHSHILSTHYEVVGRELLAGNLLRHLFIPKKALSRYGNEHISLAYSGAARRLFWRKNEILTREITNNDESSDSLQSILNSCATNSPSAKHSCIEDCDTDTKTTTATTPDMVGNAIVSPAHSIQSCSSSASASKHMKTQTNSRSLSSFASNGSSCSKCGRKCNGISDLYRHMLDCSGDYIWSMAKKRKYRYYCGSKKRRPCNKHNILELRKNKPKPTKTPSAASVENEEVTSPNFTKTKTPPRPRPSDAESIKKMLENLPPKRICKKIFPLLNKSKKPPNMKPRLRVKHKIYRSLRKTRMRQMSQAAKILSKSKSQLHKKKGLPRPPPVTVVRGRKKKNLKIETNKAFRKKEIKSFKQQGNDNIPEDTKDVVDSPRKTKIESESDLFGNGESAKTNFIIEKRLTPKKSSSSSLMLNTNGEPTKTSMPEESEKLLQTPKKCTKQLEVQLDSAVYVEQLSKNENSTVEKTSQPSLKVSEINANKNSVNSVPSMSFTEQEKIAQTNKNVKRSKRISDCIAMLTGKLEEKLKTEQKITTPTKIIEKPMDIEVSVTPEKPKTPPLQTTITTILEHSKVLETDTNSILSPKKTPKRKTISRRIIKAPSSVSASIELKVLPEKETTPIINTLAAKAKVTITPNSIKDSNSSKHKHSTSMLIQNVAATKQITTDSKLANITTTGLIPPTLPKVMPVCALNMMPKVPLYIPVDNLRAAAPHLLPLPLPMPVPVALPVENVTQISPGAGLSTTTAAAVAGISLVAPTLSMVSAVPAHLQGPAALPYTVPGFNAEPLNLSNASKGSHKQSDASQDLSCSSSQRAVGVIPARRQTICGSFEARNFAIFEDMEPLDLSKKPRPEKSPGVTITNTSHPKPIDMVTPLLLPPPLPGPPTPGLQSVDVPVTSLSSIPSELLLNKQFYSNLDLLRIPQVRNPTGPITNNDLAHTNIVNQSCIITNTATTVSINNTTTTSTCTTKPSTKKRNNKTSNLAFTAVALSGTTQNNDTTSNPQSVSTKNKETSKSKDACGKNKVVLKMDEEVINHIDDAINSVINAVKASLLDSEDAEKTQNQLCSKTTDDVVPANPLPCIELKTFTPAKRNMRSKTLDYRPAALMKQNLLPNPILPVQQQQTADNVLKNNTVIEVGPLVTIETRKEEIPCNDSIVVESTTHTGTDDITSEKTTKTDVENKKIDNKEQAPLVDNLKGKVSDDCTNSVTSSQDPKQSEELTKNQITDNKTPTVEHLTAPEKSEKVVISSLSSNAETESVANTINTTTNNTLELEQVNSNINNTSSGFHSSAQSDLATVTSVTATTKVESTAPDASKKKQRRRRKNELAAIVADQLLESFKIDKARRDNLKKLENLAYEKSEDLLLTGMLLMSSTKRNVASGAGSTTTVESIESSSNSGANKRSNKNQRQPPVHEITPALGVSETIPVTEQDKVDGSGGSTAEKQNQVEKAAEKESIDAKKPNNKRRQYRRRGKVLDNENISKLKSSLESFSIDIERQLNEFEAKNVNVFKNVGSDMKTGNNSITEQSSTSAKSSVILRPSILSMTLEAVNQNNNSQASKTAPSDTNKSAVSSRDPRLNKNIHKEDGTPAKKSTSPKKSGTALEEIGDVDEDNYLTEIAKNVNEKIMSTENEEFAFKDDGFELVNEMPDDSNSKFSRPPTSMSVRSAPNFNDDRSNFGSICDENTNTEAMDMDLDDEMSVYTSYSQDLGRGRGRRRRRRRSILLTRKPKKRATSRDLSSEKIECVLCKKTFYSANSLTKHNMTLAHVSKVSEQEYLLSKTMAVPSSSVAPVEQSQHNPLGPYARRLTRRATISEPPRQLSLESRPSSPLQLPSLQHDPTSVILQSTPIRHLSFKQPPINAENSSAIRENTQSEEVLIAESRQKSSIISKESPPLNETNVSANSRLNLNPDERLFFECCNILKGAETPRITANAGNNLDTNYTYTYKQDKTSALPDSNVGPRDTAPIDTVIEGATRRPLPPPPHLPPTLHNSVQPIIQMATEPPNVFRDPQLMTTVATGNSYNKANQERSTRSPTYSAISQLSAVTNTTSRFKTKAAMKGYENVNIDLAVQQHESKSRTICKLTELAEIALGTEEKPPSSHQYSPIQNSTPPPELLSAPLIDAAAHAAMSDNIHMNTPEYVTLSVVDNQKNCMPQLGGRNERAKNNETRSSTSSKTIMHSSIIKAAVEEHQKPTINNKIIIPDRPFKNIGLEEKETITFQKPKTPAVSLLNDDNSVSTASFSDRDDYDFGSLSCDDEGSLRDGNDKNIKNDSTDSSTESSRATAKTFENKSLIMGRIFKNATTKATVKNALTTVKVKSVGVQKDQTPIPKADLNQLFDELRGNSRVEVNPNDRTTTAVACGIVAPLVTSAGVSMVNNPRKESNNATARVSSATDHLLNKRQQEPCMPSKGHTVHAASPPAVVSSTTTTPATNTRKGRETRSRANNNNTGAGRKTRKDISKLQTELGMSPDEIKKLIDEGQRKSKRRCATNRPKKLVEMWSSDEYEEFLSTKDIIALIEEKEQQEKRRKRKTSINLSSNNSEVAKEKDGTDVTSSTRDNRRRITRTLSIATEREDLVNTKVIQTGRRKSSAANNVGKGGSSGGRDELVSTTAKVIKNTSGVRSSNTSKANKHAKMNAEVVSTVVEITKNHRNSSRAKTRSKSLALTNATKPKATNSRRNSSYKTKSSKVAQSEDDDEDEEAEDDDNDMVDDDDDDDEDFLISELKKNNKTRARAVRKPVRKAMALASAAIVTSTGSEQTSRKRGSNNNNTNYNNSNLVQNKQQQQQQQHTKAKRKSQTNQSSPRRKRIATEKLYYWSSSSDEDFGRINSNNKSHVSVNASGSAATDNYDCGAEQYQKHGWIVGDSHKKLVTLLAIAKGNNKKVDSNCGVKKNVTKRRN